MAKPDYSDFYKFIVSLGLAIISMSVLLPWLFLRESFDTTIKASELSELTSAAQSIIEQRQAAALWLLSNITWISGLLAITGFATMMAGITLWFGKQKAIDKKEGLETRKLEYEIESMTAMEVRENKKGELEEQIVDLTLQEAINEPTTRSITLDELAAKYLDEFVLKGLDEIELLVVNEYLALESLLAKKLKECFEPRSRVLVERKIGQNSFDIILQNPDRDTIVEVKLLRFGPNPRTVKRTLNQLSLLIAVYKNSTERDATGLVLFVFPKEFPADERHTSYEQLLADFRASGINGYFLTQEDLESLNCRKLQALVFPRDDFAY